MKKLLFTIMITTISMLLLASPSAQAATYGPCKVEQMFQSDSTPTYMYVKMACDGVDLATTCTNILKDTVVYDATTKVGEFRTSMLLSAFAAGRDAMLTTWGVCPADAPSAARLYSVKLF